MELKKGFLFTLDAIFAILILVGTIILMNSLYIWEPPVSKVSQTSQDILYLFSTIQVNELDNPYIKTLIRDDKIKIETNTILKQIGEFWVLDETELAYNLSRELIEEYVPSDLGVSIKIGDTNEIIYNRTKKNSNFKILKHSKLF